MAWSDLQRHDVSSRFAGDARPRGAFFDAMPQEVRLHVDPLGGMAEDSHFRQRSSQPRCLRGLLANGVAIRQAALEVPEHIGRAERHQGILKGVLKRIVKEHHCIGKDQIKLALTVALEAKNDTVRRDGFSPSQWVLAKYPGAPAACLGRQSGANWVS